MANIISSFYIGTTQALSMLLQINGVAQDLTSDVVTLRIKLNIDDADNDSIVSTVADVASRGAEGYAEFVITPSETKDATAGEHYLDVEWVTSDGKEYIPLKQKIVLMDRVSDPPE